MNARVWLLAVLLLPVGGASLKGAAPPVGPDRPLTEEERRSLRAERARLWQEVRPLITAGRWPLAEESLQRRLSAEERLFGRLSEPVARTLEDQAAALEQQARWEGALKLREKALARRRALYGEGHWRSLNAELNLQDGRTQAGLSAEGRLKWAQAGKLYSQAARLYTQGKSAEALAPARRAAELRLELTGKTHHLHAQALHLLGLIYQAKREYHLARPFLERSVELERQVFGERHPGRARGLLDLGRFYQERGEYTRARPLLEDSLSLNRETGEKHLDYAIALGSLASLYREMGEPRRALPLYERAWKITGEVQGEKHPATITALNNLGVVCEALGDHARARSLFEQTLALRKEILGEKHPQYATSLHNLARVLHQAGEHGRALTLHEQALALRKEVLGEKHPQYAQTLSNLGLLLQDMGDYSRAKKVHEEALALRKEVLGVRHPAYAESLGALAGVYREVGDHASARALFEQAVALEREVLGEKHPGYAISLHNLARLHKDLGEYPRARVLYEQADLITREALGEKHPNRIASLNNLGLLYKAMGDTGRARSLFEQALTLAGEALGEKHPLYATLLANLAHLFQQTGELTRARALAERALALRKEALGEKHPRYAISLDHLAGISRSLRDFARARLLYEQALAIRTETLGEKHLETLSSLTGLGSLHQESGDYARARSLFTRASALARELGAEDDARCAGLFSHLALLDLEEGNPDAAARGLGRILRATRRDLDSTFSALSESQRLHLVHRTRLYLDEYLSASTARKSVPAEEEHEAVLAWKGMVLARQVEENALRDSPEVAPLLEKLRLTRAGLARLAARGPEQADPKGWRSRYEALEKDKDDLEFQIARKSLVFRALREVDGKAVRAALPERAGLVDLLEYTHWSPNPRRRGLWLSERRLLAFVLVRDREVVRLDLGPVRPIADAVAAWRTPIERLGPVDEKAARRLRERLWDRLAPALKGCEMVLIAPDGVLCGLPWGALPGSRPNSFLIEEVAFAHVSSARQVCRPAGPSTGAGLLALGGLDYGTTGSTWAALPGTRLEADRVAKLYRDRFPEGKGPRLLEGTGVSKTALAAALAPGKGGTPRFAHLATHGYFAPPVATGSPATAPGEEEPAFEVNPLLLSGLVLSGANGNAEAGVLTALEVGGLDLRGCELVVLSACETGLGKEAGGEGLLGLQRAFHVAGARAVVSSLWSVSDPATSVLMEHFYENLWREKMTRLEALRRAQLYVLANPEKVKERARELASGAGGRAGLRGKGKEVDLDFRGEARSHPAWWAGFVLSGDWR